MYSLILLAICLCLSVIKYLKFRSYWTKHNIKQADGFLWKLLTGKKSLPEIIQEIYDNNSTLPYVGLLLGTRRYLILRDIENIQTVLHSKFENFYPRDLPQNPMDLLSDNLLFIDDFNRWKLIRQKFSPFLTKNNLKKLFNFAERCARDFANLIEEIPRLTDDPYNAIYTYTSASISSKVFGIDEKTHNAMKTPFSKLADQMLKPAFKFNLSFPLINLAPSLYKLLNLKIAGTHGDAFIRIIQAAMDKRRNKDREMHYNFIETCLNLEDKRVLKDYVTGYNIDVTLHFLAAQAFVFFIGGIDTITTVLHFTLLELSKNPNILKKVHDEIDDIFQNNGGHLTFECVDKLQYMGMVLNEAMRMYPPVGVIHRRCCRDTILPVGEVKVEEGKGINVVIPIFAIHRDERYYPKPNIFDPERFSAENITKIVRYTYLPFGEGKRTCIGMRLAIMEMKTCLAWLLRKHTLKQQTYTSNHFDPSYFILRDSKARYEIVPRTHKS